MKPAVFNILFSAALETQWFHQVCISKLDETIGFLTLYSKHALNPKPETQTSNLMP
jgi:hypothetical protein